MYVLWIVVNTKTVIGYLDGYPCTTKNRLSVLYRFVDMNDILNFHRIKDIKTSSSYEFSIL